MTIATPHIKSKTNIIGHVVPLSAYHNVMNPVFMDFMAGAGETYGAAGYAMQLHVIPEAEERATYHRLAREHLVDGLIVHRAALGDGLVDEVASLGLPFVVHGRAGFGLPGGPTVDFSWVDVASEVAFEAATTHLIALGHRRIMLLNGHQNMDFVVRREMGYSQALRTAEIPRDASLIKNAEMTLQYGFQSAVDAVSGPNPPSAFLCASMVVAMGAKRAIESRGLVLGHDISIIAYDDDFSFLSNAGDNPVFTTVKHAVKRAGTSCAQALIGLIKDPSRPHRHILHDAPMVLGRSCGPYRPMTHIAPIPETAPPALPSIDLKQPNFTFPKTVGQLSDFADSQIPNRRVLDSRNRPPR